MRRYSILHPLWMAFYSGDIYDDVARNWRIQPFLYLIILLAIGWLPQCTQIQNAVDDWITQEAPLIIDQIPVITISEGELSTSVNTPVLVHDQTGQVFLIIDDTGESKEKLGRLVIDLESIMSGSTKDIILEDGDRLHIPKIQQNISVIGEVFVPRTHLFAQDLNIDDYISLSGGVGPYADADNIYLIKSDGSMVSPTQLSSNRFFRGSSRALQPGDSIVVPLEVQPFSGIKATNEITQIIYQMALAAAAVNSF